MTSKITNILMEFKIISLNKIIIEFYKSALYLAIEKENIEIIKLLLMNDKIDVNKKSFPSCRNINLQQTALHLAVEKDNLEIVKLLLGKKDIDINLVDLQGKKPIDYSKSSEVRQLLSQ